MSASRFAAYFAAALLCSLLAGCMVTTKRGEFALDVRSVEGDIVHVSCYLEISALLNWEDISAKDALERIITDDLLLEIPKDSFSILKIMVGSRGEPGANMLLCGADVRVNGDALTKLKAKVGRRRSGSFSLPNLEIIRPVTERSYP